MIVGPETWPVICPACKLPLDSDPDMLAKAYVIPDSYLRWSQDTCYACSHTYRARRLSDGMIEFELVDEGSEHTLQEEDL